MTPLPVIPCLFPGGLPPPFFPAPSPSPCWPRRQWPRRVQPLAALPPPSSQPAAPESTLTTSSRPPPPPHPSREVSFNPNHPRRKLLVQFKCNACGEFTDRAINREAYDRGTVFVQCAGCLVHHKLVDNLGLIVEYDLREDSGANTNDAEI